MEEGYAGDTAVFYAIFAIAVSIMFIAFVVIVNTHSTDRVELPAGLDTYLLSQRFIRSPDCFAYEDISGRAYSNIIDFNKFTETQLNNCYIANEKLPAFRLKLSFQGEVSTIQTTNWDNSLNLTKREKPLSILVHHNDKNAKGDLSIEMQNV